VFTVADGVAAPVPLTGATVSQVWLSETLQLSVPPPVLEMLKVWPEGLAPPAVALKVFL
jgi:hypothetical protein